LVIIFNVRRLPGCRITAATKTPMKKYLTFVLLVLALRATASHLVGGEFQIIHISQYQYRINLILYIDDLQNINQPLLEPTVITRIFRNSDGIVMRDVILTFSNVTHVAYTQPNCAIGQLMTSRVVYSTVLTLQPELFNHPDGYYIVWERCCRNYTIINIVSDQPPAGVPDFLRAAGQTFFLQFPPVIKGGVQFKNTSPQLSHVMADYGCSKRMFNADFAGFDADGDSLAYSIVTPLSTQSSVALPVIGPKPYPEVMWRAPFHSQNIMGGNPDLKISTKGLLTVVPNIQGVFAFAIKCEEYRKGEKIGEVRREYQFLVVDCPVESPPVIEAKTLSGSYTQSVLAVHFSEGVSDDDRCIKVKVNDSDVSSVSPENIRIKAIPTGFDGDISTVLPSQITAALTQVQPFAEFSICFDQCPLQSTPFEIAIIAYDDACSIPLSDTVRIQVSMAPSESTCNHQQIFFPAIPDRTIGNDPFSLNAVASSGLPVAYASADATVASVSFSTVTLHKPGEAVITATQPGNGQYRAAIAVVRKFCINPLPPLLTIGMDGNATVIVSDSPAGNVWYRDGVEQTQLTGNTIHVPDLTANYTAKVMAGNCRSEASNSILITHAEHDVQVNEIEIFPNPVNLDLEIHLPGNDRTKNIELQDTMGRTLISNTTTAQVHFISMESLNTGTYHLKVQAGSRVYVRKVLKK
jgi:hypothetical protein